METLYTIGHSTHSIDRFTELLAMHQITAPDKRTGPSFLRFDRPTFSFPGEIPANWTMKAKAVALRLTYVILSWKPQNFSVYNCLKIGINWIKWRARVMQGMLLVSLCCVWIFYSIQEKTVFISFLFLYIHFTPPNFYVWYNCYEAEESIAGQPYVRWCK